MAFRPCIDLKDGRVVQLVGGSFSEEKTVINSISAQEAAYFASLYQEDGLRGGHVIMLGPGNEEAARRALNAYPHGLQIGGGMTPDNAGAWLDAGASHVIMTSWLFPNGAFELDRLRQAAALIGKRRLVVDLSCRRLANGSYHVATNLWRRITPTEISEKTIAEVGSHCDELLIHAADVEGKCEGIDEELIGLLTQWVTIPTTYAGGARQLQDITRVEQLSENKIDLTIGSALDIFGGAGVRYAEAAQYGRR